MKDNVWSFVTKHPFISMMLVGSMSSAVANVISAFKGSPTNGPLITVTKSNERDMNDENVEEKDDEHRRN